MILLILSILLLSICENIIGVKEASGIPSRINHLRTNTHSDFVILSGDDFTMIDAFVPVSVDPCAGGATEPERVLAQPAPQIAAAGAVAVAI